MCVFTSKPPNATKRKKENSQLCHKKLTKKRKFAILTQTQMRKFAIMTFANMTFANMPGNPINIYRKGDVYTNQTPVYFNTGD